ncbi:MAG: NAD(P)/FAD-dependent oxidoreductase, partial [Actinomycetota bacterium]|nr:NAD(P)/FAD-dependent oxidoreductase [Actinomycetota bacterium]
MKDDRNGRAGAMPIGGAPVPDYEVLIIGAGVTGLYQLYRARQHDWSVRLLEAGSGVGGTWYWNRYPSARTDSEGYTYGFFISELLEEWDWSEHFPSQPELETYFNLFTDRFDLRKNIEFGTRVVSADWDEVSRMWTLTASDGALFTARYVIAASGVLSVPFYPHILGANDFQGVVHHTAEWPSAGVDVKGKRVAVIGTGSSGIQLVPSIVDEVEFLTVYQRTPNWAMPLNNSALTHDDQEKIRADYPALAERLRATSGGFLH